MRFKQLITVLLTILITSTLFGESKKEFNYLRGEYVKVLKNRDLVEGVYGKFKEVQDPSAKLLAYKGALEAIMTGTTWNFFKKIGYLNKSEVSFNHAVEKSPKDVEIRFMRMAVEFEIPSYLGYSENMENDRKFIINNIEEFNTLGLDDFTLNRIIEFMKRCNQFTESQVDHFEDLLAQN